MSVEENHIPFADPRADLASVRSAIIESMCRVLDGGSYILGAELDAFEREMAARIGVSGTIGVASGTDALVLGLLALGVGPGDEVITVSHTAGPTAAAIHMTGAIPVLVDIDPSTYCMDVTALEGAVSARTRAILPVHLYGHPAALDAIAAFARKHELSIVEDCAQAQEALIHGRQVGSIGDVGCFSFYPTKSLGAIGDGGLVTASAPAIVERLRRLRTYGWTKPQFSELPHGRCSRLDELQAAILRVKLAGLAEHLAERRAIAQRYHDAFADLPLVLPCERPGCHHVYHLYVVRCDRRDALAKHLLDDAIGTGIHYPHPVHRQPGFADRLRVAQPLTVTEAISPEILSLPLYPSLSLEGRERVIAGVRGFFGKK